MRRPQTGPTLCLPDVDGCTNDTSRGTDQMNRPSRGGAPDWTREEFDLLFDAFPPHGARPRPEQVGY